MSNNNINERSHCNFTGFSMDTSYEDVYRSTGNNVGRFYTYKEFESKNQAQNVLGYTLTPRQGFVLYTDNYKYAKANNNLRYFSEYFIDYQKIKLISLEDVIKIDKVKNRIGEEMCQRLIQNPNDEEFLVRFCEVCKFIFEKYDGITFSPEKGVNCFISPFGKHNYFCVGSRDVFNNTKDNQYNIVITPRVTKYPEIGLLNLAIMVTCRNTSTFFDNISANFFIYDNLEIFKRAAPCGNYVQREVLSYVKKDAPIVFYVGYNGGHAKNLGVFTEIVKFIVNEYGNCNIVFPDFKFLNNKINVDIEMGQRIEYENELADRFGFKTIMDGLWIRRPSENTAVNEVCHININDIKQMVREAYTNAKKKEIFYEGHEIWYSYGKIYPYSVLSSSLDYAKKHVGEGYSIYEYELDFTQAKLLNINEFSERYCDGNLHAYKNPMRFNGETHQAIRDGYDGIEFEDEGVLNLMLFHDCNHRFVVSSSMFRRNKKLDDVLYHMEIDDEANQINFRAYNREGGHAYRLSEITFDEYIEDEFDWRYAHGEFSKKEIARAIDPSKPTYFFETNLVRSDEEPGIGVVKGLFEYAMKNTTNYNVFGLVFLKGIGFNESMTPDEQVEFLKKNGFEEVTLWKDTMWLIRKN